MVMLELSISSLVAGGAYALIATCLVLQYRMVGVLNFAICAFGVVGTHTSIWLSGFGWPYLPAALVGAFVSALLSSLAGYVMATYFAEANLRTRSTVMIAMTVTILSLAPKIFGSDAKPTPELLPGLSLTLGGVVLPAASLAVLSGTLALALGIGWLLANTRLGVRLRALSERPMTAELLGLPATRLAVGVWAFSGAISSLALLVIAPSRTTDISGLTLFVLPALAAALLGLFKHLPTVVLGGLGIGLIESIASGTPGLSRYDSALPLLLIVIALLWSQRREVWDAAR
jgi:branched-chain amino acid transport system permease protein